MLIGWERSCDPDSFLILLGATGLSSHRLVVSARLEGFLVALSYRLGFGWSAVTWGPLDRLRAVWRLWGLGWALGRRLGFGAICRAFGVTGQALGSLMALGLRLGFGQPAGLWGYWPGFGQPSGFGASAGLWAVGWALGLLAGLWGLCRDMGGRLGFGCCRFFLWVICVAGFPCVWCLTAVEWSGVGFRVFCACFLC